MAGGLTAARPPADAATLVATTSPYLGVTHLVFEEGAIPARIHLVVVDLTSAELSVSTTAESERGKKVSQYSASSGAQIVINGDFFAPADFRPRGLAMGGGAVLWSGSTDDAVSGFMGVDRNGNRSHVTISAPEAIVAAADLPTGTQGVVGEAGPELRRRFCERLGLGDPGISWTSARDRIAEVGTTMASSAGTLARIGNEVYQLQRSEIAELREPSGEGTVGSITMPHKRNPEASEHLVTLSRLVRHGAAVLLEGQVQEHERDGRGWKAEWVALPEVCLLTGTAAALARDMVERLEFDEETMARNLGPFASSEAVLAALAPRVGKHRAQELLQEALARGAGAASLEEALRGHPELAEQIDDEVLAALRGPATGSAGAQVDEVLVRIRRAREGDRWP